LFTFIDLFTLALLINGVIYDNAQNYKYLVQK